MLQTRGDIPFNCISRVGTEARYIEEAYRSLHLCGDGTFTARCHGFLESVLGASRALLTTSCTHALEMAAHLLRLRPGDEVIIPSFTFPSVANAFVLRGAKPVFADIRPDTMNLDEKQLASLITPKTRAIFPVHYAGVGCEMDEILAIAAKHGLAVVEDNAHGLFGKYKGRYLGTFGCLATQSFHETKNFSCGEGGALLINDPEYLERAEILREKGTNRKQFFRGAVDKYTWVDVGSSYLPSDILAAILFAQFEVHEAIQEKRRACWLQISGESRGMGARGGCTAAVCPGALRTDVSHVLSGDAGPGGAHRADRTSAARAYFKRISLHAAAYLGNGAAIWRVSRAVSGSRACQRPAGAAAAV